MLIEREYSNEQFSICKVYNQNTENIIQFLMKYKYDFMELFIQRTRLPLMENNYRCIKLDALTEGN